MVWHRLQRQEQPLLCSQSSSASTHPRHGPERAPDNTVSRSSGYNTRHKPTGSTMFDDASSTVVWAEGTGEGVRYNVAKS